MQDNVSYGSLRQYEDDSYNRQKKLGWTIKCMGNLNGLLLVVYEKPDEPESNKKPDPPEVDNSQVYLHSWDKSINKPDPDTPQVGQLVRYKGFPWEVTALSDNGAELNNSAVVYRKEVIPLTKAELEEFKAKAPEIKAVVDG